VATAELPPKETVPEPELEQATIADDGVGDVGVGVGNPVGNAARGGGWAGQDDPVQFDESLMTPPRRLSGPDPEYTERAREQEVEGAMVVRCVVTARGVVRDCRVIQGLPHMNEAVVRALLRRRYEPARLANGTAVDVDYTFHLRFQIDR
jgi:protein TonB